MTIKFSDDVQQFIDEKVRSGQYESVDAVLMDAVRQMQQFETWLRKEAAVGFDELDRGEGEPWDVEQTKQRLIERLRAAGTSI
jgi:putative addiction module CopG family antidote